VVGVGDVFGNGMLLSEHIRLVAAFDQAHLPRPGPERLDLVLRAEAAVRPAPVVLRGLQPGADLGRRRDTHYRDRDPRK
jgi:hypothetical protein